MPSMRVLWRWWSHQTVRSSVCTVLAGSLLLLLLHYLIRLETQMDEFFYFRSLPIPDDPDFVNFGVSAVEELPTSGQARIPKRIHQTWKSRDIPQSLHAWIRSWADNHPDWEYWLWTDESARQLVADRFPSLLPIYDGYREPIRRADALRYIVLHEYGGVYADMDMESLRPLDSLTYRYACFIGQEPYIHPIMDTNMEGLAINALMACRPKHPFFAELIERLPDFAHMWSPLDSAGPHFLTSVYLQYKRTLPQYAADHDNGVYLAPAEYFYPDIDPEKLSYVYGMCGGLEYNKLGSLQQRACQSLKRTKPREERLKLAFTNHHWIHTYLTVRVSLSSPQDIGEIVQMVNIYFSDKMKKKSQH